MSVEFLDTNILIYAFDSSSPQKHDTARQLITNLNESGNGALSIQVLSEFYSVSTRKLKHPTARAHRTLASFQLWTIHTSTHSDLLRASRLQQHHNLSWWDALVLNSAQQVNASILWTEDLNHNQRFGNLTIRNPFLD